jgi:hypothetical protein
MKKELLTIAAAVTMFFLNTQANAAISIAPILGGNSFKIAGSGMDSRSGSLVGVDVIFSSDTPSITWETGLNYLEAGAKTDMFFASTEYALGYLAIPLIANWNFYKTSGGSEFFVKGGGYLTQLMSAKQKTQVFGASQETDIKDLIAKNDIMITAGIGGRWGIYKDILVAVNFDYAKGTVNTVKDNEGKSEGWILASSLVIPL